MLQTKRKVKNGASIRFQFQILLHIPNLCKLLCEQLMVAFSV